MTSMPSETMRLSRSPAGGAIAGALREAAAGPKGERISFEKRYIRPDGREVWIRSNLAKISGQGRTARFLKIVEDISDRKALEALTTGPLNTKAFEVDDRLKSQLEHPPAYRVMKYLVECALREDQAVQWTNSAGLSTTFKGQVGLCQDWEYGPPSRECLGYVTACLLARNNAFGVEVPLSMRGEDPRDERRFNPDGLSEAWGSPFLSVTRRRATRATSLTRPHR